MSRRALRLLVVVVLAAAGCGRGATLAPGPERGGAGLSATDIQSIAIVLRLEDRREFQPDVFDRLAEGGSEEVRRRVVAAAGRIGDSAAVPFLTRSLESDPSFAVRADAAFALGELGDTAHAVVEALGRSVAGDWTPVRPDPTTLVVEVIGALGKLGTEPAWEMVRTALREAHPGRDPLSRRVAAEALLAGWRFGRGPGHLQPVARFLDSADPELRWRAAYSLMRPGDPDAAPLLLSLLDDSDPRVRALAARGLPRPRADSAGIADTARTALATRLRDPHPHVRVNALRALGSYGEDAPVEAIADRLRDDRPDVAVAAASALGALGARARDPLAAAASDAALPLPVRAAAAAALAPADGPAAGAAAAAWAGGDAAERYQAARLLAFLGWDRGHDLLDRLARDADARVAVAALASAGELAADSSIDAAARQGLHDLLLDAVGARDPRRRAAALRALDPLLTPGDLEPLLDVYRRAADDSAATPAAIAAVDALAALDATGGAGVPEAFMRQFGPPRDRWIAHAVAGWLGEGRVAAAWGDGEPRTTVALSDDPEVYRGIVRDFIARPLATGQRPEARISTRSGEIVLELLPEEAPLTVYNFMRLARAGYFDDGVWHRVVPNFVIQDGAPAGDPSGGPGWSIRDEINRVRYDRGTVGMALSGPDTGGSQWFITHSPQPHLDGGYTVFARVKDGMDAVDGVLQGDPIRSIRVDW